MVNSLEVFCHESHSVPNLALPWQRTHYQVVSERMWAGVQFDLCSPVLAKFTAAGDTYCSNVRKGMMVQKCSHVTAIHSICKKSCTVEKGAHDSRHREKPFSAISRS